MFKEYLQVAIEAARVAGKIQLEGYRRPIKVGTKRSFMDLVTEVDHACEAEIVKYILNRFPDHQILAEEGTTGGDHPEFRWIVDPLDGTTNYFHRYPFFSVSIAFEFQGEVMVGVVYDALHDELFHATEGGGAFLNGQPISVSDAPALSNGLLCSGFPGDQSRNHKVRISWEHISRKCQSIRRDGSAALDLCYVACGRLDGFWEQLNPWDIAAGTLIVQEAGGTVTNFHGGPVDIYRREIVASNGLIGTELVEVLQSVA